MAVDVSNEIAIERPREVVAAETTYLWESAAGGGTRMTLRNRGQPTGFSKLVAPFLSAAMHRANRKDLLRLKSILEASSA